MPYMTGSLLLHDGVTWNTARSCLLEVMILQPGFYLCDFSALSLTVLDIRFINLKVSKVEADPMLFFKISILLIAIEQTFQTFKL